MAKVISVTELRRRYSTILKDASNGAIFVITRYGKPMAKLDLAGGLFK
jgi:antitoxin (DNA-binding transcriptional repressor) of toxin-antitoxin stability system